MSKRKILSVRLLALSLLLCSISACGVDETTAAPEAVPKTSEVPGASFPQVAASDPTATDGDVTAAPCGLSYSGPIFGQYNYTIRNCHDYAVDRKLDLRRIIIGYPDGPCKHIPAHSEVRDTISIPDSVYIAGIKGC